ncbi:MAG: hypothetical protein AB7M12_10675 [Hyphomonadaceae bacterium]
MTHAPPTRPAPTAGPMTKQKLAALALAAAVACGAVAACKPQADAAGRLYMLDRC